MKELKVRVIVAVCAAVLAVSVMLCSEGSGVADPVLIPAGNVAPNTPKEIAQENLADMMASEDQFAVLADWTTRVQECAGQLMQVFKENHGAPKCEYARPAAQEIVRQEMLHPKNWFSKNRKHLIYLFGYETGWTLSPLSTGAAGERGLGQFIPSTAKMGGYDFSRMNGTSSEDIRYQVRCVYDWAGHENTRKWCRSQWTGLRLAESAIGPGEE